MESNACFILIRTKHSSNTLLSLVRIFTKQTLVQCSLDLVTSNLVTTCELVTTFQRPFFNLLHKTIRLSDIMQFIDSFLRRPKVSLNQDCTVLLSNVKTNMEILRKPKLCSKNWSDQNKLCRIPCPFFK